MNKILETHYNLNNHTCQVRLFEDSFKDYIRHIIISNDKNKPTKSINSIDNKYGNTLGIAETIENIITNIGGESFIFRKHNKYNNSDVIVSLVVIDEY